MIAGVLLSAAILLLAAASTATAQEPPYFVIYSQALEEPGNLEISMKTAAGTPKYGNAFSGGAVEFEYGATAWPKPSPGNPRRITGKNCTKRCSR